MCLLLCPCVTCFPASPCPALPSLLQLMKFKRCCVILVFFQVAFLNKNPSLVARAMDVPSRQPGISFICSVPIRCSCATPWCPSLWVPLWLQIQDSGGPWKGERGCQSSFLPLLLASANNGRGLSTKHRAAKQNFITGAR